MNPLFFCVTLKCLMPVPRSDETKTVIGRTNGCVKGTFYFFLTICTRFVSSLRLRGVPLRGLRSETLRFLLFTRFDFCWASCTSATVGRVRDSVRLILQSPLEKS